jgi:signal transduction histidine kinase/ActR/RegA family two-component response regulator
VSAESYSISAQPSHKGNLAIALAFGAVGGMLLFAGRRDYPSLHAVLDTGMVLLSAVLAWFFWDLGARMDQALPRRLAASFAATSLLELVYVLVVVDWWGVLAPISDAARQLRPMTWPLAAHVLPAGIGAALLTRNRPFRTLYFTAGLLALGAALFFFMLSIPGYVAPEGLGISRPSLALAPLLWVAVAVLSRRLRAEDRLHGPLAAMALVLILGNLAMLFSQGPHDSPAMVAHLGRVSGYLLLMVAMMRFASRDMNQLAQIERALAADNRELEARVLARTADLESEAHLRRHADQKVRDQVGRLNLLDRITRAIGERQDLDSIFQVVLRSVEENLPLDFGCICLYDSSARALTVQKVGVGSEALALELALEPGARLELDENGLSSCLSGQLVYEPDIRDSPFPFTRLLVRGGLGCLVAAPLLVEGQIFGVILAGRRQVEAFSSGECEFLRQLSEHVALAVRQAQTYAALSQAYLDLRESQQAIFQQERLRSLGQMASGIAHDINNAITPAALYVEGLLEREKGLSPRGIGELEIVKRAIHDAGQTVSRMREFYRERESNQALAPVGLNTLALQVVELARARWSDLPHLRGVTVEVRVEPAPEEVAIQGVESEVREALLNLVFNAVDAMPEGGLIRVRIGRRGEGDAARGLVEVIDTGVGMSEETRARCAEPFFTTKGERGTGLAMVQGIAQRHQAELEIDSILGEGSTLRLVFPAPSEHAPLQPATEAPQILQHRRLLVVDDDPVLLLALRNVLDSDRHHVVSALGGQAGLDTFRAAFAEGNGFDLVLTDLGMPHMGGDKLAAAIKEVSPETPVVLLTGWGARLVAGGKVPPHVDEVLSKPPKLHDLRAALVRWAKPQTGQAPAPNNL